LHAVGAGRAARPADRHDQEPDVHRALAHARAARGVDDGGTVDVHELTAAYALHALDAEERETFEAHLAQCGQCREELSRLSEPAAALAWAVESPAPPPELRDRILAAAADARDNVVPLARPARTWRTVAAIAACVAVGLAIWGGLTAHSLGRERAHAN